MKTSVLGLGEVGGALYKILKEHYEIKFFEPSTNPSYQTDIMHVCFPYFVGFEKEIERYECEQNPKIIVIHSTVPVGTTKKVSEITGAPCFHSPIRGKHPGLMPELLVYKKYISWDTNQGEAEAVRNYFRIAGVPCETIEGTKNTELSKLLELCRYGVYIAFAKEQQRICEQFGCDYTKVVNEYERDRTEGLKAINRHDYIQPILYPFEKYVGGHCTVEDMEIMLSQIEMPLLRQAYDIDRGTKIWGKCNIYKTAKIGKGVTIGNGTEIGENVVIGNSVRIGAQVFIPEGVTIENDVFIGPKVTFSNDKYPPSKTKDEWGKILVKKGASIGMGSIILPDVEIGEGALIGAGSVVTKSVPKGEKWFGNPARSHGKR